MRSIVVIGGGPAGTFAAIAAKKQDPTAAVTLLTCEHCEPYEKPPLSKAVLLGSVSPEDALIAGPGGVAGHDVVLKTLAHCTKIDRADRAVVVDDGRRIRYDVLVIATGSAPRQIPQLPIGMPRVHYLRTEADARALKAALQRSRTLLVVGGGLIGLEVAASAAMLGVNVTVLEVAPRILARVCDEQSGTVARRAVRNATRRDQTCREPALRAPNRSQMGAYAVGGLERGVCARSGSLSLGRTRSRRSARGHRAESPRRRAAARSRC